MNLTDSIPQNYDQQIERMYHPENFYSPDEYLNCDRCGLRIHIDEATSAGEIGDSQYLCDNCASEMGVI